MKNSQIPYIEIHEDDAADLNIADGDPVSVASQRAEVSVVARISPSIRQGVVFMPFHWGDLYAPGQATNNLTNAALDPISKEPEYKVCAVRLAKLSSKPRHEQ